MNNKKGLGYNEIVRIKKLWGDSNEIQKEKLFQYFVFNSGSPQETNPTKKEESSSKNQIKSGNPLVKMPFP